MHCCEHRRLDNKFNNVVRQVSVSCLVNECVLLRLAVCNLQDLAEFRLYLTSVGWIGLFYDPALTWSG